MMRTMMKSKIHRAAVTQADLQYVGTGSDAAEALPGSGLAHGDSV